MAGTSAMRVTDDQISEWLRIPDGWPASLATPCPETFKTLRQILGTTFKDYENTIGRIRPLKTQKMRSTNPAERLWVLFGMAGNRIGQLFEGAKMRPHLPLSLAMLRYAVPNAGKDEYNGSALRRRFSCWFQVEEAVRHMPATMRSWVMAAFPLFDAVERWAELSPEEQVRTEIGLLGLADLLTSRVMLDKAMVVEPALVERYAPLKWPGGEYTAPPDNFIPRDGDIPPVGQIELAIARLKADLEECEQGALCSIPAVRECAAVIEEHAEGAAQEYGERLAGWFSGVRQRAEELGKRLKPAGVDSITLAGLDRWEELQERAASLDEVITLYRATWPLEERIREEFMAAQQKVRSLSEAVARTQALAADPVKNASEIALVAKKIELERGAVTKHFTIRLPEPPKFARFVPLAEAVPESETAPTTAPESSTVAVTAETESLLSDLEHVSEELQRREEECHRLRAQVEQLSSARVSLERLNGAELAVRAILRKGLTPEEVLTLVAQLHGEERLVVLDSAFASARESASFQNSERLLELLVKLGGEYVDMLRSGKPDAQARHCFGNAYHARESTLVQNSPELRRLRTFRYEDKEVAMYAHLGVGVVNSLEKTIRVHFHWDAEKGRVAIGYCGPHLPTSTNRG